MTLIQFVVMSCVALRLAVAARSTRLSPLAGLRATGSAVRTCAILLSALARVVADCATAPQRMLQLAQLDLAVCKRTTGKIVLAKTPENGATEGRGSTVWSTHRTAFHGQHSFM